MPIGTSLGGEKEPMLDISTLFLLELVACLEQRVLLEHIVLEDSRIRFFLATSISFLLVKGRSQCGMLMMIL